MQIGTRGRGGKGWGEGGEEHEDEVVRQMSKIVHTRSVHLSQSPLFTTHCYLVQSTLFTSQKGICRLLYNLGLI